VCLADYSGEVTSTRSWWRAQRSSADVVNLSLVTDAIVPRRLWSTMNHFFRTGQGRCAANHVRLRQSSDPTCICGASEQTIKHTDGDRLLTSSRKSRCFTAGTSSVAALRVASDAVCVRAVSQTTHSVQRETDSCHNQ